ncbi:MAG: ferritin family protein [Desulfohalobiaceae bacterium]|nr:ferritin family protein [Desulfohalobiaceae bacterium]
MDLQQALQTAMKGEVEGRELYRAAAEKTGDSKAREVFGMLADEEQSHLDSLTQIAKDYEEGKDLTIPQLPAPASFEDAESPIFTREFKEKVADFDMTALSIGMKLELESEKAYRQMAAEADQNQLKELFTRLADWEQGHFDYLQKQMGFLESYYTKKYSFFRF